MRWETKLKIKDLLPLKVYLFTLKWQKTGRCNHTLQHFVSGISSRFNKRLSISNDKHNPNLHMLNVARYANTQVQTSIKTFVK